MALVSFITDFTAVALNKPFTVSLSRRAVVPLKLCIAAPFVGQGCNFEVTFD
jgi:hypothetical protein